MTQFSAVLVVVLCICLRVSLADVEAIDAAPRHDAAQTAQAVVSGDGAAEDADALVPPVVEFPPEELVMALKRGDEIRVRSLLAAGADPNALAAGETHPMHVAASQSQEELLEMLLEAGADVDARDSRDLYTPLHHAAAWGRMRTLELLLAAGANTEARSRDGRTPLVTASWHDKKAAVEFLLGHGADLHAKTHSGSTALHMAAIRGSIRALTALVHAGSDVQAANKAGVTPLMAAAAGLASRTAGGTGQRAAVDLLIMSGAAVNAVTRDGRTALHLAAGHGHLDVADVLLKKGADVTLKTASGDTPAQTASNSGFDDVAAFLDLK